MVISKPNPNLSGPYSVIADPTTRRESFRVGPTDLRRESRPALAIQVNRANNFNNGLPSSYSVSSSTASTPRRVSFSPETASPRATSFQISPAGMASIADTEMEDYYDDFPAKLVPRRISRFQSTSSIRTCATVIVQEDEKQLYDPEQELFDISRSLHRWQKYSLIAFIIALNGFLIFGNWYWINNSTLQWALFFPLLAANTVLQDFMIICIVGYHLWQFVLRRLGLERKPVIPATPETFVIVLPCYNETPEELTAAIDALVNQEKIDEHPRVIIIVVDGHAKSPGCTDNASTWLMRFLPHHSRKRISNAYVCRDGRKMDTIVQLGDYREIPYILVIKGRNQGKRDSLVVARSFVLNFNKREQAPTTIFSQTFFDHLGDSLVDSGIDNVTFLLGLDGDTRLDPMAAFEMMDVLRKADKDVVGCCGHVVAEIDTIPLREAFGFWTMIQTAEYTITQGLRRCFQSIVTGKVNCLPGCCQLFKVEEATFGDKVLREMFGYVPPPSRNMVWQIMANYSEDSIHASMIFSVFPEKKTAQALRAKAYTVTPQNWSVFLSQRKRWSLGATANATTMAFRPNINWFERFCSLVVFESWLLSWFIMAAIGAFIKHCIDGKNIKLLIGLASIVIFKYLYCFALVFWIPKGSKAKWNYFGGLILHIATLAIMNIAIGVYSLWHADDFKWGKTREVAVTDVDEEKQLLHRLGH